MALTILRFDQKEPNDTNSLHAWELLGREHVRFRVTDFAAFETKVFEEPIGQVAWESGATETGTPMVQITGERTVRFIGIITEPGFLHVWFQVAPPLVETLAHG